jgi:hypothetical protein
MSIESQHAEPDRMNLPKPMTPERAEQFRKLAELSRKAAAIGSPDPILAVVRRWNEKAADMRAKAEGCDGVAARVMRACAMAYENAAKELRGAAEKVRGENV